ncbi:MAG TPA: transglycosylase SLT domain-containing protein [Silvibacterium sp.]|nr:transglycosylase SLT domain-containing protein [Silvibacterium sp.]
MCAISAFILTPGATTHAAPATAQATTRAAKHKPGHQSAAAHPARKVSSAKSHARARHAATTRKRSRRRHHRRPLTAREIARSRKLQKAFVASSQLRPMAQQLATLRSPAAYAGVTAYAHAHSGEAASAAYLALGHAYLLDHKYGDAVNEFHSADREGTALDDYATYLAAQAWLQDNNLIAAQPILATFIQKYPDSVFVRQIPVLQANLFLQQGDPQNALAILNAHKSEPIANKPDFQLALAKANLQSGRTAEAQQLYTHVYLNFPLSFEATQARAQLLTTGAITWLSAAERSRRADALYAAHRYSDAEEEYRSLATDSTLDSAARNSMLVAAAACQWKLHSLNHSELDRLPDSSDEAGARRLYLYMELARDKNDTAAQQSLVAQLESRFPSSPWLAEALYSSGNMYLLQKDYPSAIRYYSELSTRFPKSCESPHSGPCSNFSPSVHWRAAWLTYRIGNYTQAAQMFDDQLTQYAGGEEVPAALYWRGRIYADQQHDPVMAAKYYRTLARVYRHYYYADLAEARLSQMNLTVDDTPTGSAQLDALQPEDIPELSDDVPDQDPHLVKARLLANAGLNEYISPEIQAADGSDEWGSLAEAQIYASYGETWHAMRLMKRALPFYASAPIASLPLAYWRILFPEPYWSTLKQSAQQNGLDPYMVASLIRQESEFNPSAISNKDAYGLMQLLPKVGKELAKHEGIRHFQARDLLDPDTNLRLGCLYLRQTLDSFGGHPEYAFAAYNAGDYRVTDWQSLAPGVAPYKDMDEFVESIPFSETRNYVQAILRNEAIYRDIDKLESQQAKNTTTPKPATAR